MELYQGYKAGEPHEFVGLAIDKQHVLEAAAAKAFIELRQAAKADGVTIVVNSAFRSQIEQEILYKRHKAGGPTASRPGYSKHQSGLAVDIQTGYGKNDAFRWMTANAHRFGFKRTVQSEPWHWEFLGKPVKS